jgi:hypothetical protein
MLLYLVGIDLEGQKTFCWDIVYVNKRYETLRSNLG